MFMDAVPASVTCPQPLTFALLDLIVAPLHQLSALADGCLRRRRDIRALAALDDRMLAGIGLLRCDISAVAR
jgi:uncharacterized protein YjiS (DUF1127 family)